MKPFDTWSRLNALALLSVTLLVAFFGHPSPLGVVGLVSFGALIVQSRRAWTPKGCFGVANWVTLVRCVTLCAVAFWPRPGQEALIAGILFSVFLLDGVDGWLARRSGNVSPFGSHFDMETDALLVLVLGFELWLAGDVGPWVIASGLLRYAYVLCLALVLPRCGEIPRGSFARYAYGVSVGALVATLALPDELRRAAALAGTFIMVLSFARSFWWSYVPSGQGALNVPQRR